MDTISRDNNSSYLPVAGVIVGLLAVVLSAVALVKVSAINKNLAGYDEKIQRVDAIEPQIASAGQAAQGAVRDLGKLRGEMQNAFNEVGNHLVDIRTKLEEVQKRPAPAAPQAGSGGGKSKEPVVAGPNEYIVKSGDSGIRIARAHNVSLADLQAVNPGVDLGRIQVGQRLKLPQR